MKIRILKIGKEVRRDFSDKAIDKEGNELWNIPQDLEEFRKLAINTINWQIGDSVKKASGNTQTNLSASNAKAIALIAKLIEPSQEQLDSLTELEKDNWSKLDALANNGYADSQLLNVSLSSVSEFIAKGTDKATRVASATTHEEVIAILNED